MLNALAEEKELVLLALSSPYDILAVPGADTCLCTYSSIDPSLQALGEVLSGAVAPRGRLPVELPGLE